MDFKNSFMWLTGMKNLIFDKKKFFGLGHFLIHEILEIDQKINVAKKVIGMPTANHIEYTSSHPITELKQCWA